MTAIRCATVEMDVNLKNTSDVMQNGKVRTMLHETNIGMLSKPVNRSENARLDRMKFVMVLRSLFFKTRMMTQEFIMMIRNATKRGKTSASALKYA